MRIALAFLPHLTECCVPLPARQGCPLPRALRDQDGVVVIRMRNENKSRCDANISAVALVCLLTETHAPEFHHHHQSMAPGDLMTRQGKRERIFQRDTGISRSGCEYAVTRRACWPKPKPACERAESGPRTVSRSPGPVHPRARNRGQSKQTNLCSQVIVIRE